MGCPLNEYTFSGAATGGNLEMLKWLKEHNCPHNDNAYSRAVCKNNLEILKWLKDNDYPWDFWACHYAVSHGHLEILKWCIINGCPYNKHVLYNAAQYGHLETVKWLINTNISNISKFDSGMYNHAVFGGQLNIIEWLQTQGYKYNDDSNIYCMAAADGGHITILKWLGATRNSDKSICASAASGGHLWNNKTCKKASFNGHLNVLKYDRQHGCDWDDSVCTNVINSNYIDCYVWALENRWPETNG